MSGTTANDGRGGALHPGDTGAQTAAALRQALAAVEASAARSTTSCARASSSLRAPTGGPRRPPTPSVFGDVSPANTMLFVHALIGDDFLVEVEVDAIVDRDRPP